VVLNVNVFCFLVVHGVFNECKASLAINPNFCALVMKEAKLMQQTLQPHAVSVALVEKNAIVGFFLLAQFVTPFANKKANLAMDFQKSKSLPQFEFNKPIKIT
jgi:hypothetical protein